MKKKLQLLLLITLTSLFAVSSSANAHGGGLDGNGGHNCYVGSCAGTYHYHRNYSYRPIIPYAPMAYCINHEDGYTISELKYLQFQMKLYGYYSGPIDGIWGPKSSSAYKRIINDLGDLPHVHC